MDSFDTKIEKNKKQSKIFIFESCKMILFSYYAWGIEMKYHLLCCTSHSNS